MTTDELKGLKALKFTSVTEIDLLVSNYTHKANVVRNKAFSLKNRNMRCLIEK